MPTAAAIGIGTIVSGVIGAEAVSSAASTQAGAISDAATISAEAAAQARQDVIDIMAPALSTYSEGISNSIETLRNGQTDVFTILNETTGAANEYISQAGADAMQAILGGQASSQGVSRQDFEQQYTSGALNIEGGTGGPGIVSPVSGASQIGTGWASQIAEIAANQQGTSTALPASLSPEGVASPSGTGSVLASTADRSAQGVSASNLAGGYDQLVGTQNYLNTQAGGVDYSTPYTPISVEAAAPTSLVSAGTDYGFAGATQALAEGEATAQGYLTQSAQDAIQAAGAGLQQNLSMLSDTEQKVLSQLSGVEQTALGYYDTYADVGNEAALKEAALSGALGVEAQQAALDEFIESPAQTYLREQAEQALLRNASATGGLGSGTLLTELQENAMGYASTYQQQAIENLRSIATRGQEVAGSQADITTGLGSIAANAMSTYGMTGAQNVLDTSNYVANVAQQLGISQAQLAQLTSQQQSELAMTTGLNIAEIAQATQLAQASNVLSLGSGLASTAAGTATDVANLISGAATTGLQSNQDIATLLANIGVGAGSQASNYAAQAGSALAAGQTAQAANIQSIISGLTSAALYGLGDSQASQNTISSLPEAASQVSTISSVPTILPVA